MRNDLEGLVGSAQGLRHGLPGHGRVRADRLAGELHRMTVSLDECAAFPPDLMEKVRRAIMSKTEERTVDGGECFRCGRPVHMTEFFTGPVWHRSAACYGCGTTFMLSGAAAESTGML